MTTLQYLFCTSFLVGSLSLGGKCNVELPPPQASVYILNSSNGTESGASKGTDRLQIYKDIVNTDVEIATGINLYLECNADNPIQWIYRGSGKPEFQASTKSDILEDKHIFKAGLRIPNANEKDTGMYVCSYTEYPRIASTYHVFVPGNDIFVPDTGRSLLFTNQMSTLTIPCPVSVKTAKVTLRKVHYDNTLKILDERIAPFDPKVGFRLNLKDMRDPDGTYVCSAQHEGNLRLREYFLTNEERNLSAVTFPGALIDDINPCLSYFCPSRSVCRVNLNTNSPFCACRSKSSPSSTTNCTRLCKSSIDCPKTEKCHFNSEKQLKMCVHMCHEHQCAENAECYIDEQRSQPRCRCRRGYEGNGDTECERIPFKTEEASPSSYCSTAKCGPNAKCQNIDGKVQCVCYVGHFGSWPNCQKVCTQDTDCDLQEKCSSTGACEKVCAENVCAPSAECKVLRRKPMCICPPGFTGKATEACYQSHFYYSSRMGLPDAEGDLETTTVREENMEEKMEEGASVSLALSVNDK